MPSEGLASCVVRALHCQICLVPPLLCVVAEIGHSSTCTDPAAGGAGSPPPGGQRLGLASQELDIFPPGGAQDELLTLVGAVPLNRGCSTPLPVNRPVLGSPRGGHGDRSWGRASGVPVVAPSPPTCRWWTRGWGCVSPGTHRASGPDPSACLLLRSGRVKPPADQPLVGGTNPGRTGPPPAQSRL